MPVLIFDQQFHQAKCRSPAVYRQQKKMQFFAGLKMVLLIIKRLASITRFVWILQWRGWLESHIFGAHLISRHKVQGTRYMAQASIKRQDVKHFANWNFVSCSFQKSFRRFQNILNQLIFHLGKFLWRLRFKNIFIQL